MLAIDPYQLRPIIDTREVSGGRPYCLSPPMGEQIIATLPTGDYSIAGLESRVVVERKALSDFLGVVGSNRDRFEREIDRLRAFEAKVIVVEASWRNVTSGDVRSGLTPQAIEGAVYGWMASGVPVHFAGDRTGAQLFTARFLFIAARRFHRSLEGFSRSIGPRKRKAKGVSNEAP